MLSCAVPYLSGILHVSCSCHKVPLLKEQKGIIAMVAVITWADRAGEGDPLPEGVLAQVDPENSLFEEINP